MGWRKTENEIARLFAERIREPIQIPQELYYRMEAKPETLEVMKGDHWYWVVTKLGCCGVTVNSKGKIIDSPPLLRRFVGQHYYDLTGWSQVTAVKGPYPEPGMEAGGSVR